jgi:hypothetical protein
MHPAWIAKEVLKHFDVEAVSVGGRAAEAWVAGDDVSGLAFNAGGVSEVTAVRVEWVDSRGLQKLGQLDRTLVLLCNRPPSIGIN